MKNVDVPMWDKGDDTDSFTKGGASSSFSFTSSTEKNPMIKQIYELVLGREPSSREMSYYKYSAFKKEDIVKKLLESDEHKSILEKAKEFPKLKQEGKKLESTVLKLKSLMEDKASEYLELKRLIVEKNSIIESLRSNKDIPFLTNKKILEEGNSHYSISRDKYREEKKKESFIDRLLFIFFGK